MSETEFQCQHANSLYSLQIESAKFSKINNIFANLTSLEVLNINLTSWPTEKMRFDQLVNLKFLKLLGPTYTISDYSFTLKHLKNLKYLELSGCTLEENCFEDLSNLEILKLEKVNIKMDSFKYLKKLRVIKLSKIEYTE